LVINNYIGISSISSVQLYKTMNYCDCTFITSIYI